MALKKAFWSWQEEIQHVRGWKHLEMYGNAKFMKDWWVSKGALRVLGFKKNPQYMGVSPKLVNNPGVSRAASALISSQLY